MARDVIHNAVKQALINDGWEITADPFHLKDEDEDFDLEADLAADRPVAAEKAGRKIAVEIKSFIGRSLISEFYLALGQYLMYLHLLERIEPDRKLFLAVSDVVYDDFFQLKVIQKMMQREKMAILVVNTVTEEVMQWISWNDTDK